jgi:hypothetical protein
MALNLMTFSTTLKIIVYSIMAFGTTTLSVMTLNITINTFIVMTFSNTILSILTPN